MSTRESSAAEEILDRAQAAIAASRELLEACAGAVLLRTNGEAAQRLLRAEVTLRRELRAFDAAGAEYLKHCAKQRSP